jgi:hypothetical protein
MTLYKKQRCGSCHLTIHAIGVGTLVLFYAVPCSIFYVTPAQLQHVFDGCKLAVAFFPKQTDTSPTQNMRLVIVQFSSHPMLPHALERMIKGSRTPPHSGRDHVDADRIQFERTLNLLQIFTFNEKPQSPSDNLERP